MISFKHKGDFINTTRYFERVKDTVRKINFKKYGEQGVAALAAATPVDTGLTANSWRYEVKEEKGRVTLSFCNSNIQNGVPIAIILHYGHGTNNGGWVEGRDYINPAIQPIFDKIANDAWKEVKSL